MKTAMKRTTRWTGRLVTRLLRAINPADGRIDRTTGYRIAQWGGIVATLIIVPGLVAMVVLFVLPLVFSVVLSFIPLVVLWYVLRFFFSGVDTDPNSSMMKSAQHGNYEAQKQRQAARDAAYFQSRR